MNVKDIKGAKMKVRRLALVFLSFAALTACNNNNPVFPDDENGKGGGDGSGSNGNKITLKIYVPKGSISTYASEDASAAENRIDTLFVDLWQSGTRIESDTITGANLKRASNTNDSILTVAYNVDELVMGQTVTAKVYANRKTVKPITEEIQLPNSPSTAFLMTGEGNLTYNSSIPGYEGTIHVIRDVAKLRINVSKDAICLPSDLTIDYNNIKIEVLHVPNQTSLFGPVRDAVTPTYINYMERTGRKPATFNATTGGQIDSLYLNENYRNSYTEGSNTTQVKITLPTFTSSGGHKTDSYIYTLKTNNSYDIVRNYIYTLDIKVRGQSLEPLIALSLRPWNDVNIDGSIGGTYLTMQTSEIEFDANGYAEIAFCTDAQAVYVDYDEFNNNNNGIKIGDQIKPVGIQPTDPNLTPGYDGQVLVDKKVCTSFGFRIDPAGGINPASYNFSGKICIKAGNIVKCISFVGQRYYDAHFIVGDTLLNPGDLFTSAVVDDGGGGWLEVSPDRLYTSAATQNYTNSAPTPLYLHLNENLTSSIRKGSIAVMVNGVEKKIYIQQLPALPVGPFGYEGAVGDDANLIFSRQLLTEQLFEYPKTHHPMYGTSVTLPTNNNIYNGLGTARSNFDAANYSGGTFNWRAATYQAINYCAYKNRDENRNGTIEASEIKWYLPAQAQLMAMWASYESYKDVSTSNFKTEAYWSSTNNNRYLKEAQYLNFTYGNVGHNVHSTEYWARCVRNGNSVSTMLVTNQGGMDIDFAKGMPQGSFTSTPKGDGVGDEQSDKNKTLYRKLRVSNTDNGTVKTWDEAKVICAGLGTGWRLPTQKELEAIWILKSEMVANAGTTGFTGFSNDYYWTATENSGTIPPIPPLTNAFMVYMASSPAGDAGNTPHTIKTHTASVRCVKEL